MAISTAVDVSAVARVVGIKTTFKDLRGGSIIFLPQRKLLARSKLALRTALVPRCT